MEIEFLLPAPAAAAAQHAPLQIMMQQQGIIDGKVATTPALTGIAKQTAVLAGMTPNVQKISRGSPIENVTTDKSVMKKKNKSKEKNTALQSPSIVVGKKKSPQSVPNVAAPVFPTAPSQPTASSLHEAKSQENATDDPTRHPDDILVGNEINGVHDRVDPVVIELKNSVHNCLRIEASDPEMESVKLTEASTLEIPSLIQSYKINFQSAEEHQEPKVVQQLISPDDQKQANAEDCNSNSGHHVEMDFQKQRKETESTKLGEFSNESDLFPMEAKYDEVVQEAEADAIDGRDLIDQGNDGSACVKHVASPPSKFPNDCSWSTGGKLLSDVSFMFISYWLDRHDAIGSYYAHQHTSILRHRRRGPSF